MMQFRVVHRTRIGYEGEAAASYNEARMTPFTSAHQLVLHTRLEVSPTPWSHTYRDYWGTEVTAFEVLDTHKELVVTATSTVQVDRPAPLPGGLTWDEVRSPEVADRQCESLVVTPRVAPDEELAVRIADLVATTPGPTDFAHALCRLVHDEVSYEYGSTEVHGHAADAWAARSGVCQDMAHIVIGGLRSVGVPARYVSGYLHPTEQPVTGETVVGESHAWVEWWDGSWIGFDPTNNLDPGDRHVVVARGRDYADVPPLSGVYSGGGTSELEVDVRVTRLR
ncbi:transglutaminase family protein [Nocardioides iriomotensis]|uniref:Transglutaminase family protein n=1 Tax=Nocardioides iriomotensis TaxID=715784 RepID=A0A4Q5J5K6_9ACTN|nr:transglutaminase family protein [Nocardioides iriomotensis]RYU12851.1 transglutaminase family protein [Nocardioides iriomotensis]